MTIETSVAARVVRFDHVHLLVLSCVPRPAGTASNWSSTLASNETVEELRA